jgi:glycosyltransferase involved in cell wall biosynthesis
MVKVSILMAAHNEEKYISEAIKSVINQTFLDWELIIINDRSQDNTSKIVEEYTKKDKRIKLINLKKNRGWKSGALNKGLKIAKGKYICILDGDDIYLKDKLDFQVKFMNKNKNIDMIYGKLKCFGEKEYVSHILSFRNKDPRGILHKAAKREDLNNLDVGAFFGLKGSIPSCSVMLKSSVIKKFKFDESLPRTQDYDMWFQIIGKGYILRGINKIFYKYRRHPSQSIKNLDAMNISKGKIISKLKRGEYFKN